MAGKNFDPNEIGEGINDINITPFVDVVLVLLVIFMVTTPIMIKEGLKVNLPKTLTSDSVSKSVSMGIAISKEGQVFLAGRLLTSLELDLKFSELSKTAPDTQFLISADSDARHGDVVKVIDQLKKNNLNSFAIQIERIKN
jgi:biopolymer transport protein ExbD